MATGTEARRAGVVMPPIPVTAPAASFWSRWMPDSTLVLFEWSLRREAPGWLPKLRHLSILVPVILACVIAAVFWPHMRYLSAGRDAVRGLMIAAVVAVIGGGVQVASRAICWQISSEMRDLVRVTGVNLRMLLWSTTFAHWWTIGWSVVLLLPLGALAVTMGGVSNSQLTSIIYGLTLLASLTAAFGMLSSILMASTKNHERSTSSLTIMGMILYNAMFSLVAAVIVFANAVVFNHASPFWDKLADTISSMSPWFNIRMALFSYQLFDPSEPGYWMHYFTAIFFAGLATWLVEWQFRKSPEPAADGSPSIAPVAKKTKTASAPQDAGAARPTSPAVAEIPSSGRRRCTERPFFWKDVYVLSEERRSVNIWTVFYVCAAFGVALLALISTDYNDRYRCSVMSVVSLIWVGLIVSLRFDSLLTAEFRDRTWGSLMLLPVDPVGMLWTKLGAALWEQRFVVIPTGLAQLIVLAFGQAVSIIIAVIVAMFSIVVCGLLCQMSCLNQLLNKAWWVGPVLTAGCVATVFITILLGVFSGGWIGSFVSAGFLVALVLVLQYACINPLARNWVEP